MWNKKLICPECKHDVTSSWIEMYPEDILNKYWECDYCHLTFKLVRKKVALFQVSKYTRNEQLEDKIEWLKENIEILSRSESFEKHIECRNAVKKLKEDLTKTQKELKDIKNEK